MPLAWNDINRLAQASRETGLRPAEQSLGDNGWQYAERPQPSASGVKKEALKGFGGEPFVAMMQAADLWEGDDLAGVPGPGLGSDNCKLSEVIPTCAADH